MTDEMPDLTPPTATPDNRLTRFVRFLVWWVTDRRFRHACYTIGPLFTPTFHEVVEKEDVENGGRVTMIRLLGDRRGWVRADAGLLAKREPLRKPKAKGFVPQPGKTAPPLKVVE